MLRLNPSSSDIDRTLMYNRSKESLFLDALSNIGPMCSNFYIVWSVYNYYGLGPMMEIRAVNDNNMCD